MDKWDLIEQAFFDGTFDAAWNESEHPREGGKFTSQGGGGGGRSREAQKEKFAQFLASQQGKKRGGFLRGVGGGVRGAATGALKGAGTGLKYGAGLGSIYGLGSGIAAAPAVGPAALPVGTGLGALMGGATGATIGVPIGAIRGAYRGAKGKDGKKLKGEDALRKRGAAVNRSPIRHHGGRVPKAKDAFGSRISGALRGAVSGAKAGRQATGQRIAGTMAGGVGGAMHGWRGAPIVPRLNNRSAALMSAKAQRR